MFARELNESPLLPIADVQQAIGRCQLVTPERDFDRSHSVLGTPFVPIHGRVLSYLTLCVLS